ncbi:hypothetical protein L1987_67095 [Smallanthus sonchifolius]|uniref:Uncharacterized protein n=1 Tax=Smallanthus sonchifolius TaxID=185202 RepID=A0ACB9BZ48_9ASTR|nr:hypothetical protein L1987_67095 [Smallanthus sonchifolius]
MERNQMHRQIANTRKLMFDQGYLDEQFIQLEELQDGSNPNFVEEVVTLYYRDSARFLSNLDQALEKRPLDFSKLDNLMHQFKGSSTSIGAKKVKTECTHFRNYCNARNAEGCKRTFQNVKKEYTTLRKKLEAYFQMSRQVGPVETAYASSVVVCTIRYDTIHSLHLNIIHSNLPLRRCAARSH